MPSECVKKSELVESFSYYERTCQFWCIRHEGGCIDYRPMWEVMEGEKLSLRTPSHTEAMERYNYLKKKFVDESGKNKLALGPGDQALVKFSEKTTMNGWGGC